MPCWQPHPYGPYNSLLAFPSPRSFSIADGYSSEFEQVVRTLAGLEQEHQEAKKNFDESKKKLREIKGRMAEYQRFKMMLASGQQVGFDFYWLLHSSLVPGLTKTNPILAPHTSKLSSRAFVFCSNNTSNDALLCIWHCVTNISGRAPIGDPVVCVCCRNHHSPYDWTDVWQSLTARLFASMSPAARIGTAVV